MDVEKREWGQASPLDYIPVIGFIYRFYWLVIARKGLMIHKEEGWLRATRLEFIRLLFSMIFTVALVVYLYLGSELGLQISLLLILSGVFIYKTLSIFIPDL